MTAAVTPTAPATPLTATPASGESEPVTLDRCARFTLVADGWFALGMGAAGLLLGRLLAELAGLPAWLVLTAAVGLLPYGFRALQAERAGRVARSRVEGLALLNVVWAATALSLLVAGWIEPTGVGFVLVAGHVGVPAVVAAVLLRTLRKP